MLAAIGAAALTGLSQAQMGQTGDAQQNMAQQAIPDAPRPQTTLPNLKSVTPGKASASTLDAARQQPAATAPVAPPASASDKPTQPSENTSTVTSAPGEGLKAMYTLRDTVNFVDIPFTVKDSKGKLVPGLTARDVQIYENGLLQHITNFTTDAFPLSVALVVDQTMTYDNMVRVNDALNALQGAFTPYDEVAVFTFNNGPKMITDFTAAQSPRLTQAIEISKGSGREPLLAGALSGPLSQTTVINNQNFDPNTAASRGHTGIQLNAPKETHALNDAILEAATSLSRKPIERRRVIYVISDGKEYGSTARTKDVVRYLNANRIEVDGTLVGDSSLPIVGFLDRIHLPLMMRDNILPVYANATGGVFDAEFRTGQIEKSFSRIAEEVRSRYTVGYYTKEPFIDGKYRTLEVKVLNRGNDLTILARKGYYPSAMQAKPHTTGVTH